MTAAASLVAFFVTLGGVIAVGSGTQVLPPKLVSAIAGSIAVALLLVVLLASRFSRRLRVTRALAPCKALFRQRPFAVASAFALH